MLAAVLQGPGAARGRGRTAAGVGPDEVLVAVDLCGICGSDLHMVLEGWAPPGTWQGHEWVGTVAEVGAAVERWSPGDRVVGGPTQRCGTCAMCRAARPALCAERDAPGQEDPPGAFATYKLSPAAELLALPDGLDPRAAALAEPLAVALHAISQGGVACGTAGAGARCRADRGAARSPRSRTMGVDEIACVEPNDARRELAGDAGRHAPCCGPSELEVPSIAEPGTGRRGCGRRRARVLGSRVGAMEAGLAQLVRAGTLVLVGAGIEPPRFDPNRILLNELVITGAFTYDSRWLRTGARPAAAAARCRSRRSSSPATSGSTGSWRRWSTWPRAGSPGKVLVRP